MDTQTGNNMSIALNLNIDPEDYSTVMFSTETEAWNWLDFAESAGITVLGVPFWSTDVDSWVVNYLAEVSA